MQHRGNWFPYFRWMKVQTQTQTYLIAGMEFSSQYSSGGFYKHCNKKIIIEMVATENTIYTIHRVRDI